LTFKNNSKFNNFHSLALSSFKLFVFNLSKKNDLSDQLSKVVDLDEFTKKKIVNHNIARIRNYFWKNIAIKYKKIIDEKIINNND